MFVAGTSPVRVIVAGVIIAELEAVYAVSVIVIMDILTIVVA